MRHAQLRAFHQVALTGGFTRAAEALHLTQPAISDQVRTLEQDYDLLLFERSRRQVRLTPQGEALFEITKALFDAEARAHDFLTEARGAHAGTLRIVADAAHHVTGILSRYRARHPGVTITVATGNTDQVLAALYAYEADIGVTGELPQAADLDIVPLGTGPIVAFAAAGSPFAAERLTLAALAALPLVLREPGSRTRTALERAAAGAGIALAPAIEAEGREAVREIVASGAGVGFVSAAEFGRDARLAPIDIADATITMDEALVCLARRRDTRIIRAFMALAAEPGPRPVGPESA